MVEGPVIRAQGLAMEKNLVGTVRLVLVQDVVAEFALMLPLTSVQFCCESAVLERTR